MTRPSLIVLMHDNLGQQEILPKIFVRTLLYATGNRGHVIQSMYLKIQHGEMTQNFSVWGHGPQNNLKFGAGLKVGPDGLDHNHHFNPPKAAQFQYTAGDYLIDIFAEIAESGERVLLGRTSLRVTAEQAEQLKNPETALYFEWGPDSQSYQAHLHSRTERVGFNDILKLLSNDAAQRDENS